jgi:ABC-type antimicrobial peptide transport system permease subunit
MLADLSSDRIMPQIIGTLALVALVLALIGVYGVVAYTVAQRVHEMGLRMALGARAGDVLRLVVRQGLGLAALGVGVGLLVSLAVTRALSSFLWGITSFDPITFVSAATLLLVAGMAASYLPARRATRVDPIVALRTE